MMFRNFPRLWEMEKNWQSTEQTLNQTFTIPCKKKRNDSKGEEIKFTNCQTLFRVSINRIPSQAFHFPLGFGYFVLFCVCFSYKLPFLLAGKVSANRWLWCFKNGSILCLDFDQINWYLWQNVSHHACLGLPCKIFSQFVRQSSKTSSDMYTEWWPIGALAVFA